MLRNHTRALRPLVLTALAALLPLAACFENSHDVTVPAPVTEATLSGRVLSWPDATPVAGASLELVQTDLMVTTDADGYFTVEGLRPGSYQYLVRADSLLATRGLAVIDDGRKAEDLHIHQNVYLMQPDGAVTVSVVDHLAGDPLEGVAVRLVGCDFPDDARFQELDDPRHTCLAVTDAAGAAALTGLPLGDVTLEVASCDTDGDGEADLGSRAVSLTTLPGVVHQAIAVLEPAVADEPVGVLTSNLPPDGESILARSLYCVFTEDMNTGPMAWTATLRRNAPDLAIPDGVTLDGVWTSARRLELTPLTGLFEPFLYRLELTATSASGETFELVRSFIWQTPLGQGDCTDPVTGLAVTGADALDFDDERFELTWDALPGAGGYLIYARDDRDNPAWVPVDQNGSDHDTGTITHMLWLPDRFDRYQSDPMRTPLAGTAVTLCVVPLEADDPAPGGGHAMVTITDQVPPTLQEVYTTGDFDNTLGTEASSCRLNVVYSEYLAPGTTTPVLEFQEAGGDSTVVLDPASATWTWYPGLIGGSFTIAVPPQTDASGDRYRIVLESCSDQSGNAAADTLGAAWREFGGGE